MFTETFDCAYETFKNEVCVVCVRKWGADGRGLWIADIRKV